MARIANEVYVLARAELGEVREPTPSTTVGSISMPHKRNPEVSASRSSRSPAWSAPWPACSARR